MLVSKDAAALSVSAAPPSLSSQYSFSLGVICSFSIHPSIICHLSFFPMREQRGGSTLSSVFLPSLHLPLFFNSFPTLCPFFLHSSIFLSLYPCSITSYHLSIFLSILLSLSCLSSIPPSSFQSLINLVLLFPLIFFIPSTLSSLFYFSILPSLTALHLSVHLSIH